MSEELIQHYATAPVFAFVIAESDKKAEVEAACLKFHAKSKVFFFKFGDSASHEAAITSAVTFGSELYTTLADGDVKKAFDEFDADKSGAIDKNELSTLCEKLGCPLSEENLQKELETLDLNGDGVIQIDEFKRWYFTGMKPYGDTKKSMLQVKGSLLNIFDVINTVKEI